MVTVLLNFVRRMENGVFRIFRVQVSITIRCRDGNRCLMSVKICCHFNDFGDEMKSLKAINI